MRRFWLFLSRASLTGWVGIGAFFALLVIQLRGSPLFSEETKLAHPKVLFPLYYSFEFWLLGISLLAGWMAQRHAPEQRHGLRWGVALIGGALLIATIDYFAIYRPLAAMLDLPARPPDFRTYHVWSRWINATGLILSAAGMTLLQWPSKDRPQDSGG